jgi:hypothetical protein
MAMVVGSLVMLSITEANPTSALAVNPQGWVVGRGMTGTGAYPLGQYLATW